MYYVYILLSEKDKKFYIGFTSDLKRRLKEHNEGKNPSTKSRRAFKLLRRIGGGIGGVRSSHLTLSFLWGICHYYGKAFKIIL